MLCRAPDGCVANKECRPRGVVLVMAVGIVCAMLGTGVVFSRQECQSQGAAVLVVVLVVCAILSVG